jgi:small subunit ribosomal protein S15
MAAAAKVLLRGFRSSGAARVRSYFPASSPLRRQTLFTAVCAAHGGSPPAVSGGGGAAAAAAVRRRPRGGAAAAASAAELVPFRGSRALSSTSAEASAAADGGGSSSSSSPAFQAPLRFGVPADTEMSEAVRRVLSLDNASRAELVQARVARAIEAFQERRGDTGSSAVQVAALTVRIEALKEHMAKHRKDNSSKRGLDALNNKRRKILKYMKRKDFEAFRDTVRLLNLDNIVKSLK